MADPETKYRGVEPHYKYLNNIYILLIIIKIYFNINNLCEYGYS